MAETPMQWIDELNRLGAENKALRATYEEVGRGLAELVASLAGIEFFSGEIESRMVAARGLDLAAKECSAIATVVEMARKHVRAKGTEVPANG
jgi:hypothetical protein